MTEARIKEIKTWQPLQKAITEAETELDENKSNLVRTVNEIKDARDNLIPENPSNDDWSKALEQAETSIAEPATKLREFLEGTNNSLEPFDQAIADCLEQLGVSEISGLKKDEITENLERIKSDTGKTPAASEQPVKSRIRTTSTRGNIILDSFSLLINRSI